MFKQCQNCNTLNPNDSFFCKKCGAALPVADASSQPTAVITRPAPGFSSNNGRLALWLIGVAIAAILAISLVVSLLSNNAASRGQTAGDTSSSTSTPAINASPSAAVLAPILPTVTPLPATARQTPAEVTAQPTPTATNRALVAPATPRELIRISPYDLAGSYQRGGDRSLYGRPEVALYGVGSNFNQGAINFRLDNIPSGNVSLKLTGLDDERAERCGFVVILNGVTIYNAEDTFPQTPGNDNGEGGEDRYWGQMTIAVPPNLLKAGTNNLVLRNTTAWYGYLGIPYILINSVSLEG